MDRKVMIVDGDAESASTLAAFLKKYEYDVLCVGGSDDPLTRFKAYEPDIVVTDVILPDRDGFQLVREIRAISARPIIVLSSKSEVFDKVLALALGADDYVVKPADEREVEARIKAVLRRSSPASASESDETIRIDKMEISLRKYALKLDDKFVDIPPKELELLYFLVANCNRVFTRDQLLDKVWSFDYLGDSRTVDVHVKRIRKKIQGVSDKWDLKTVWGVGYKFELSD